MFYGIFFSVSIPQNVANNTVTTVYYICFFLVPIINIISKEYMQTKNEFMRIHMLICHSKHSPYLDQRDSVYLLR